ncbi:hypothetical protein IYW40_09210 [Methylocystis sp. H4A]|uniref:hypothetical protein n=1 Tax=Methylocystis sp. H4A TaxID=2785788 RepID=UPI0018C23067|nr:hypothetical protein [Methylocystis sp. H4A]MBG0801662.1 hypothetical protein [Methylocystis sp. H4A]
MGGLNQLSGRARATSSHDRFGLPIRTTILDVSGESAEQRAARIAATEAFAREAALAVLYQVGRKEALRLFTKALEDPKLGKRPEKEFNDRLLAEHDRQIANGVKPHKAVSEVAKLIVPPHEDDEAIKRRIRRLRVDREKERAKTEQERARKELEREKRIAAGAYRGTFLGRALSEPKTDK